MTTHEVASSGWDIFLLDYHVEAPISTIFSPAAMEKYHRIFNFLFGLQRIQSDLSRTWNKFTKGQTPAPVCLHKFQVLRADMLNFINNLQYYIMVEVVCTDKVI